MMHVESIRARAPEKWMFMKNTSVSLPPALREPAQHVRQGCWGGAGFGAQDRGHAQSWSWAESQQVSSRTFRQKPVFIVDLLTSLVFSVPPP